VLNLLGASTPVTRVSEGSSYKEIIAVDYLVDNQRVYSSYVWTGERYQLRRYEFCGNVFLEYCTTERKLIEPLDLETRLRLSVQPGAVYHRSPADDAPAVSADPGPAGSPLGIVEGGQFYLVDYSKGECGFVARTDIIG
jgi:hypothetical protein